MPSYLGRYHPPGCDRAHHETLLPSADALPDWSMAHPDWIPLRVTPVDSSKGRGEITVEYCIMPATR